MLVGLAAVFSGGIVFFTAAYAGRDVNGTNSKAGSLESGQT